MTDINATKTINNGLNTQKQSLLKRMKQYRVLYLMLIPGLLCVFLFNYAPIGGLTIAFKDFSLSQGIWGSEWVGFKHFVKLFSDPVSLRVIKNTIIISLLKLAFSIPVPIIFAMFVNELTNKIAKKTVQTVSYLPHFISWVIAAGMITNILSPNGGVIPLLIGKITGQENLSLLTEPKLFRGILVTTELWKEMGWSSVVYMAALSGIDVAQYEAAVIDGASRLKRMIYITLPSLAPLVVTVTILACGSILNAGFDQIFNMQNSMVKDVSDIIDTYVYRIGMVEMSYSFSSAVGLFKSLVGLIMLTAVNFLSRKLVGKDNGIW